MSNSEHTDVVDMPSLLVNGSSTFKNQNRWMSGFSNHRAAFEEAFTSVPSYSSLASFPEVEPVTASAGAQFSTMKGIPQDTRPTPHRSVQLKQGSQNKCE